MTSSQHDHSVKAFNHGWLTEPAVLAVYVKGRRALRTTSLKRPLVLPPIAF